MTKYIQWLRERDGVYVVDMMVRRVNRLFGRRGM